ncbi:SCO family protein [Filobacillus milosensis]|uniref:SCO family protein n=1 Tax=Filobacillus milosensis TaxID=94137 RepID=A0A4Y8IKG4_9BACI|nr:SCO family protein [Filobacillus milosensis]TFB14059.1 SCO family protein [Filobacillus milosensis]
MSKKHIFLGFSILVLLTVMTGCGSEQPNANADESSNKQEQTIQPQYNVEVQDFTFTNQDNEKVSLEDLKGEFWVANLIFTSCETVCPPMTANMAKLQDKLEKEGLEDIRLVSFSVDPTVDSKEALKEFGNKFDADYSNWDFLTGYSQAKIEEFAAQSFKALVSKVDGEDQVNHDINFMLINPDGEMINRFKGTSFEEMNKIVKYLKHYKSE